ncbi:MAG: sodium/solute symporter [Bacteroidota bacterium]
MIKSEWIVDMTVVLIYFTIVLVTGLVMSRKYHGSSANDFLSGGKDSHWFKTGLTLVAMSIDTGIMAVAGIGFVWGLTIQWNAVNLWITAPLAAMFFIPIFWRTKITTTPELLEKRFNPACRMLFAIVMALASVVVLTTLIYLGSLFLNEIFDWPLYLGAVVLFLITGLYVAMGGMKTVMAINVYQAIFMAVTIVTVAVMAVHRVGGIGALIHIESLSKSGTLLTSTIPKVDFDLFSDHWYPIPSGIVWAIIAGTSWIACNFTMAQRLLTARNEEHAQKAMLFLGCGHIFIFLAGYVVGVCMHELRPDTVPDKAYITVILEMFPVGIRGILMAGLMASLLSTVDGVLTSSGTLITKDIVVRFISKSKKEKELKTTSRLVQAVSVVCVFFILPQVAESSTAMAFLQGFLGDIFGVIVALYLVGIFSTRVTSNAAFAAGVSGIVLGIILDVSTDINFANVGIISFVYTIAAAFLLSQFEKPKSRASLQDLTVYTIPNVKGPFVGLNAWPALWKWIVGIQFLWIGLTALWEYIIIN